MVAGQTPTIGNARVNLSSMLKERAAANRPVRIGQIGAGKFGTMFLSQVRLTTGMHLMGLADLMPAARQGAHDGGRLADGADRGQVAGRRAQDRARPSSPTTPWP